MTTSNKKSKKILELERFLNKLKLYKQLLVRPEPEESPVDYLKDLAYPINSIYHVPTKEEVREQLLQESGALRNLIGELTGKEKEKAIVTFKDNYQEERDLWFTALGSRTELKNALTIIDACIDLTLASIGKLTSDIESGGRNENGNILKVSTFNNQPAKAFISHGKESIALEKTERFIRALGMEPLIVKNEASQGKAVLDKVTFYLSQSDCVIILATGDNQIDGKLHPRENISHEVGLAQTNHSGRIIYLLEEGTEFPSNYNSKVWERFNKNNMEAAFQSIVLELRAFGILQTTKPSK